MVRLWRLARFRKFARSESGFLTADLLVGLAALALIGGMLFKRQMAAIDSMRASMAGERLMQVRAAAEKYVFDNAATLDTSAASGPVKVLPSALVTAGYLPSGFVDTNSFRQTHVVVVRRISSMKLEFIVATQGGETMDQLEMTQAGSATGSWSAGFISSLTPTAATGMSGGWSVTLTSYTVAGVTYSAGHMVAYGGYGLGQIVSDLLHRSAVSGQPNANRMNTSIDMNGNDVTGVADLKFSDGTYLSDRLENSAFLVSNNTKVNKPNCINGSPAIYVMPVTMSDGLGNAISGVNVAAPSYSSTQWNIVIQVVGQDGTKTPASPYAQAVAWTKCT